MLLYGEDDYRGDNVMRDCSSIIALNKKVGAQHGGSDLRSKGAGHWLTMIRKVGILQWKWV